MMWRATWIIIKENCKTYQDSGHNFNNVGYANYNVSMGDSGRRLKQILAKVVKENKKKWLLTARQL